MKTIEEILQVSGEVMPPEFTGDLQATVSRYREPGFKIPILGGMKAGKSTLLAGMLSCESSFLPPDVLEATARVVKISYGFAACRKVVHAGGAETLVDSDETWSAYVRGRTPLPAEGDALELELPDEFLRDFHVTICDTPGNNTIDGMKVEESWSAIAGAQVALYCIRATSMLSRSDVDFLRTALPQLRNFIFVLTRLDEAGIDDVESEHARELVDYVRARLEESFPVKPLAIVATSSRLEGGRSGIQALKRLLADTVRGKGDDLRDQKIAAEFRSRAAAELPGVRNRLAILETERSADSEAVSRKVGQLKCGLSETAAEKETALRRLGLELKARRAGVREEILSAGRNALARAKSRADALTSSCDLVAASQGIIYSESDIWRKDVERILSDLDESGNEILSTAASEFVQRLEQCVQKGLEVDFKIVLSEQDRFQVSAEAERSLEMLRQDQRRTLQEVEALEQEIARDAEQIPELQRNLELVREQLDSIGEYKPEYRERTYRDSSAEEAFGKVGQIADWVLLLAPIPMGKLKWLNKFKYGKKIKEIVGTVNKAIRAKDKLLKKVGKKVPVVGDLLERFSAEYWTRQVGRMVDNGTERTVLEEDPEVRRLYQEQVAPYLEQEKQVAELFNSRQQGLREKEAFLESCRGGARYAEERLQALEAEIAEERSRLDEERELEALFVGKRQFAERVASLFLGAKASFVAPLLDDIDGIFRKCEAQLSAELVARMDKTLEDLKRELSEAEAACRKSAAEREGTVLQLRRRRDFLLELTEDEASDQ